jgi:tRNA threonylcarbamoyl adenosine modification protein YeaZ
MTTPAKNSLLAIDSSSSCLRLAVRFGEDRLVKSAEEVERAHGQMIMRKLSNLLDSGGIEPGGLRGIVVCVGPGSFTGLRVGIAVAKGMAVALEIPIVGVSLFDVAAYRLGVSPEPVTALVLQRKGEYLAAKIENGRCDLDKVTTVSSSHITATAHLNRYITIGPVEASLTDSAGAAITTIDYDASDLLYLGEPRLDTGGDNIDTLEPLYFGKSQAEIKFDQRAKKI